jgi:exopolysaccharide production protein ExoQ
MGARFMSTNVKNPISARERWITILALFFSTGAIMQTLLALRRGVSAGIMQAETDPTQQILWGAIYLIVILFMARDVPTYMAAARRNFLFVAMAAWALMSPLWSIEPGYTAMRAGALVGTMMFGLYIGTRYTRTELMHMLAVAFFWLGAFSLAAAILLPHIAIDHVLHPGAWNGVLNHKNNFGRICALGATVAFICLKDMDFMPYKKRFYQATFILMVFCTIMSTSKTSLLLLILGIVLYYPLRAMALKNMVVSFMMAILVSIIAILLSTGLLMTIVESALGAMGRDMTMTGRTDLWQTVWLAIDERYWLGYGPGAFWVSGQGALGMIWPLGGWIPPHAHNGILELWIGLGFVGVALFMFSYIRAIINSFRILSPEAAANVFPFLYLLVMMIADTTEISIMRHNNTYWVIFVALAVRMNLELSKNFVFPLTQQPKAITASS